MVVAVSIVTGVTWGSALLRDSGSEVWNGPVGLPSAGLSGSGDYELDLKTFRNHPRLLINKAGWKVIWTQDFAAANGSIAFASDTGKLEINWHPVGMDDLQEAGSLGTATVAGVEASIFASGDDYYTAVLKPRDGTSVELQASMGRNDFDDLLPYIVRLSPGKFVAALPPEVITQGRVREATARILADVPIPPGFDAASIKVEGANYVYRFSEKVTDQIICSWIGEWVRADAAADGAAVRKAAAALRSSRNWRVLNDLEKESLRPESVWGYADKVADGKLPDPYTQGLGCNR